MARSFFKQDGINSLNRFPVANDVSIFADEMLSFVFSLHACTLSHYFSIGTTVLLEASQTTSDTCMATRTSLVSIHDEASIIALSICMKSIGFPFGKCRSLYVFQRFCFGRNSVLWRIDVVIGKKYNYFPRCCVRCSRIPLKVTTVASLWCWTFQKKKNNLILPKRTKEK